MQDLKQWIEEDVDKVKKKGMKYLSELFFHRVESRATPIDSGYMFTAADGIIMDAFENINAKESIIPVKGVNFTLQDLMQDETLEGNFLVVSIFMSFYNQHQNYIPFSGNRVYEELPPLTTFNKPMLKVEQDLLKGIINAQFQEEYLRKNNREISTIFAAKIGQEYYIVRVGDYDVDCMVNWRQNDGEESMPYNQNDRFGAIVYGSACILIVPQIESNFCKFELMPLVKTGNVCKCRKDAIVKIKYANQK